MRIQAMEIIPLWTRYNETYTTKKLSSNDNHSGSGLYLILVIFLPFFHFIFLTLLSRSLVLRVFIAWQDFEIPIFYIYLGFLFVARI